MPIRLKKRRKKRREKDETDEWEIVGWISPTSKPICTVKFIDGVTKELVLLGFVRNRTLERFCEGKIDGVPIKLPRSMKVISHVPHEKRTSNRRKD